MCDIAYELRRERHERAVLTVAARVEDPLLFIESAMQAFDQALAADPDDVTAMDQRIAELLEEAA